MPVVYRDVKLDAGYRLDLVVEHQVVVELKVVQALAPVHTSQVLTYLRLTGLQIGLILNFDVKVLTAGGVRRVLRDR